MRKTWLRSNKVCLAMGDAVALNLMFENKSDHELFFKYWKKYLGGMATLLNYHLTPTGWKLLFKTKSTEAIKAAYHRQRSHSKKAKKRCTIVDESRMLSEHFRIFISQFVRRTNARHGRKGTKVLQRFHRYVFEDSVDYEHFFEMITRQKRQLPQNRSKYQADEREYDKKGELGVNSIWKVGTRMYLGLERGFREWVGATLVAPCSPVLRKYISNPNFKKSHPPNT